MIGVERVRDPSESGGLGGVERVRDRSESGGLGDQSERVRGWSERVRDWSESRSERVRLREMFRDESECERERERERELLF